MSYKNEYLRNKLARGSLEIRSRNEFHKLEEHANEKIELLKLFFFNEHLADKDLKEIAKRMANMLQIDGLLADFGSYPTITDFGLITFVDALDKFDLKSLTISVATPELATTNNISDSVVKKLCRVLKKKTRLVHLELNVKK